MNKITVIAASISFSLCSLAHAETPVTEWTVLGPSFSYHLSNDGAQYSGTPKWGCEGVRWAVTQPATLTTGPKFQSSSYTKFDVANLADVAAQLNSPPASPGSIGINSLGFEQFSVHGSAITPTEHNAIYCVQYNHGDEQRWNQNNPAIGLEKSWRYNTHVDKVFATIVTDSYGTKNTVMAGAGRQWPVGTWRTFSADAGFTAGLWARSELDEDNNLYRTVVPFVLPVISVQESRTGLGANIALAPQLKINDRVISSTTTLMLQFTYQVRDSKRGWTAFKLGADHGQVTASADLLF